MMSLNQDPVYCRLAAVLELAYRADSNSAARKGLWVRVPPAAPDFSDQGIRCRAVPRDVAGCIDERELGPAYAYLLGLYLGDGMLSMGRGHVWRLRISLDAKYPQIVAQAQRAMAEVSERRVGAVARPGCLEVWGYWKHWHCLFPQHGHGPKHERPIRLESWQRILVVAHPGDFIAGLIHSDGCRVLNRVQRGVYPRYFFSNLSAEIRAMFIWACTLVGVESRPAGPRNIAVSRRASVAILDRLVGPKS
jgi:hypothetical protein